MGHGPRYNVRDSSFARILCCTIKVNPMSVNFIKKREYDERVQTIIDLLSIAERLSKTMCQDVGKGIEGYYPIFNTLFSLHYSKKRMENLLKNRNRYDTK